MSWSAQSVSATQNFLQSQGLALHSAQATQLLTPAQIEDVLVDACKRGVTFVTSNKGTLGFLNHPSGQYAGWRDYTWFREIIAAQHPGSIILNRLPLPEAAECYRDATLTGNAVVVLRAPERRPASMRPRPNFD